MFDSMLRKGDVLADRYRILDTIGKGGMSMVYLADDVKLTGKRWAVKASMRHSFDRDGFAKEAELLSKLDHPFFPKIADLFAPDEQGVSYIVMEYIAGETLQERFERQSGIEWSEAVRYALQLCALFDYLHRLKPPVIYRDLKPANVMIDESGYVRLVDFGIARHHAVGREADTVQLGTIGFAAPEQFRGEQTDARTDLYTLGAMLFYLLSGGRFYEPGGSGSKGLSLLPDRLVPVLNRLLADNPGDRYSNAAEARQALESVVEGYSGKGESGRPVVWTAAPARSTIVLGGLFPGCGSTFTLLALSEALRRLGIPHSVIECGCVEPALYARLRGGKWTPNAFADWTITPERKSGWHDDLTEWFLLDPLAENRHWQAEAVFQLLSSLHHPVTLIDISTAWADPVVEKLLQTADHIAAVTSPAPGRHAMPYTVRNYERITSFIQAGKPVHLIVNRDVPFSGRKSFLSALPIEPELVLPNLLYERMLESEWNGDYRMLDEPFIPSIESFIERLLPDGSRRRSGSVRWWQRRLIK